MIITANLEGVDRWKRQLGAAMRELEEGLLAAAKEQALDVRREARAIAPMGVTGTLRQRIRIRSNRRTLSATVKAAAPHAHLVTKGRRPGKAPSPEAIRAWAEARGLAGKEFILARAIGRRGTRGVPFMQTAKDRTESRFEPRVRAVLERVLPKP